MFFRQNFMVDLVERFPKVYECRNYLSPRKSEMVLYEGVKNEQVSMQHFPIRNPT